MTGVIRLEDSRDSIEVGGKASALSKLIREGFNVPPGFVITKFEPEQILKEFDRLGADRVAVRSSALAEDGTKDAWAGQLDTFLNVGRKELLDKIDACFKSAKSDRARAYAKHKKIDSGKVSVIVQKMVPADISGVAFSAHPVTNNKSQIVIESVNGLGEKLVSGSVTPDTYILDKKSKSIVEKHLAGERNLSDDLLDEVTEAVIQIEKLFGFPVDVEWAVSGAELFILQSRPITTLG